MQNARKRSAPQSGLNIQDLLIILFKHKWKIISLTLLGLASAVTLYFLQKQEYGSHAKLFVRYLVEKSAIDSYENQQQAVGRYNTVMAAEMEILSSRDLALRVAERIGVENLLPEVPEANIHEAAEVIIEGLDVIPSGASNVLHLFFYHQDPRLVQPVLQVTLEEYMRKHLEVHRPAEGFQFVSQKVNEVRLRLEKTENELAEIREKAGVISLPERRAVLDTFVLGLEEDLAEAERELTKHQAEMDLMEKMKPEKVDVVAVETPPAGISREYNDLVGKRKVLLQLVGQRAATYTSSDAKLRQWRSEVRQAERRLGELENRYVGLVSIPKEESEMTVSPYEYERQKSYLKRAKTKVAELNTRLQELQEEGQQLVEYGPRISELERRKEVDEESLKYLQSSLQKARVDEALDPSDAPNLDILQKPSPPAEKVDETMRMIILACAGGGLAAGIALAFLIELMLSRGVLRPLELETQLQIPLLLSIPQIPRLKGAQALLEMHDGGVPALGDSKGSSLALANRAEQTILPYTDAIRDRLIFHFELHDMRHKPKLVALTGLSEGAGTSTMAAGLAKAFSESDNAKVLLVDMNSGADGNNPFYNGRHQYTLPKALEVSHEEPILQEGEEEENLYIAKVTPGRNADGRGDFAPRNLYDLMPDLRASEFDYIIFDMPPVGLTSPTASMAGLMDKVLLVLDSEKTDKHVLKRRYAELSAGKADVSCLYNKVKQHAPRWIQGEV